MLKVDLNYISTSLEDIKAETPILFMFHGYGSNKDDLFGLTRFFDKDVAVISVEAPINLANLGMPTGNAWFHLNFEAAGISYDNDAARESFAVVRTFVDETIKQLNHSGKNIYALGFSQGSILAHSLVMSETCPLAGAICLSGRMIDEVFIENKDWSALKDFPIYVSHGSFDEVIPIESGTKIDKFYQNTPVNLDYNEYRMGHEINQECLNDIVQWAKKHIPSS